MSSLKRPVQQRLKQIVQPLAAACLLRLQRPYFRHAGSECMLEVKEWKSIRTREKASELPVM
jgi:hypothetical protein